MDVKRGKHNEDGLKKLYWGKYTLSKEARECLGHLKIVLAGYFAVVLDEVSKSGKATVDDVRKIVLSLESKKQNDN